MSAFYGPVDAQRLLSGYPGEYTHFARATESFNFGGIAFRNLRHSKGMANIYNAGRIRKPWIEGVASYFGVGVDLSTFSRLSCQEWHMWAGSDDV